MRFGLGWRAELGASILAHLDEIDVVEVLADDFVDATKNERRALRFLATCVPVVVHATSLGLASPERVDRKKLDAIARVVEWLEPELWSEHLAFVRADGVEIGHLAAPPRNDATIEGLARNVEEASRTIGSLPLLENVASLLDPPLSTYDEAEWLAAVTRATSADLLLDLHNLHANATNFGFDARAVIERIDPSRIGCLHLAGGRRIEEGRILDDHLHDVPDPVFDLLAHVHAERATVILERDGNYPSFDSMLAQLRRARGVERGAPPNGAPAFLPATSENAGRNAGAPQTHAFLARIYTDDIARRQFIQAPRETALNAGFAEADAEVMARIDVTGLELAARSFAKKRRARQ